MGRRREKNVKLLAGVRERGRAWYWKPTSKKERDARRGRGEKVEIILGPAGSVEARKKWAAVTGFLTEDAKQGLVAELLELWEHDPLGLPLKANGERRAESTIATYRRYIPVVAEKFERCRYGKTTQEVADGRALSAAEIERFVREHPHKATANLCFAVLDNAFSFGIRNRRTTYNPCSEVVKNPNGAREREPLPWEVECLRALAKPRLGLMMDFEEITGWRVGDILALLRAQGTADGVRVRYKKRGKRWLWEWSPELRRIWRESDTLPGATRFPLSPVFPTRSGTELSYDGFDGQWQQLKRDTNASLEQGVLDPDTLNVHAGLLIADLHFHDLRSKAHDDFEDLLGIPGHEALGNTKAVAKRHYRRREQRQRPLR